MKQPENHRVVVAGFSLATCLGYGLKRTWERAVKGESGFSWISRVDIGDYDCRAVGEIPDLDLMRYDFINKRELKNWFSMFIPLATALCYEACEHAGVKISEEERYRAGMVIGSALNGLDGYEKNWQKLETGNSNAISPYLLPNVCANLTCGKASILLGFKGPLYSIESACATGNHCVGESAKMIQRGDADVVLAGGVEWPLLKPIVYGFGNMNTTIKRKESDRAYNDPTQSSRPYSADRAGFVLSEGGGILVLTSLEYAKKHDLDIYAEVAGVGMTGDAHHYTAPNKDSICECIRLAMDDAEITAQDLDYINGHGTSTKAGDSTEVKSLREVFGDELKKIPVSSNKSQVGHSLGATAAIEDILTIYGMSQDTILPTANYVEDPDFKDLHFVPNEAIEKKQQVVLTNAFGFGGTNCCLVFKKFK